MNATIRSTRFSLLAGMALLATSCISPIAYAPSTTLVQELGREQAESEFKNVLFSTVAPSFSDVTFDGETIVLQMAVGAGDVFIAWETGYRQNGMLRINPRAISKIEVYPNNKCWVYLGGRVIEFLFADVPTAQRCADFFASFQAELRGNAGPSPAARAAEERAEAAVEEFEELVEEEAEAAAAEPVRR